MPTLVELLGMAMSENSVLLQTSVQADLCSASGLKASAIRVSDRSAQGHLQNDSQPSGKALLPYHGRLDSRSREAFASCVSRASGAPLARFCNTSLASGVPMCSSTSNARKNRSCFGDKV